MSEKPRLLLLHGAIGSKKQFIELKKSLEEKFTIYDLNFEGHGGTGSKNDFSIQLFTQNVLDWMNENSHSKISIFGYSMGGYVALNLALYHTEKVETIVTYGTKFNWDPQSAEKESRMLNPEVIEEKVPVFASKLKQEHSPEDWKEVLTKTSKMMIELGNGTALKEKDFKAITNRVIIGIGTADKMVTQEESKEIANWLPHASFVELEGLPHPIDQIDNTLLSNFIFQSLT